MHFNLDFRASKGFQSTYYFYFKSQQFKDANSLMVILIQVTDKYSKVRNWTHPQNFA